MTCCAPERPDPAWRLARGLLLGYAGFALAAALLLAGSLAVPAWLLPLCALAGVAVGGRGVPLAVAPAAVHRVPWLPPLTIAVVGAVALVLAYGAVATPDRDWDGIVAWGLKAAALGAEPTIAQPLFADAAVLHHSPDYPLLQPLCIASLAQWLPDTWPRLLFALNYVLLAAVVGLALRRHTGNSPLACWCALGAALTPYLIRTGGGSVDSGYADAFYALALAAAGAGLLLQDALLLGAGAVLLPMLKPEGLPHALGLVAIALVWLPALPRRTVVIACAAAVGVELPLQVWLSQPDRAGPSLAVSAAVWGSAFALLALRRAVVGWRLPARAKPAVLGGVGVAALAILLLARPALASSQMVLTQYVAHLDRVLERLPQTPEIFYRLTAEGLSPRRLGLLSWLLLALLLTAGRGRRQALAAGRVPMAGAPAPLVAFLALLLTMLVAAFFVGPETDLRHHLRSSAPRLFLQLCGVGWVVAGAALLPRLIAAPPAPWLARLLGLPARP
ncbi:MAG: hypothetical protein AB7O97_14940 [Planctomycetota bacterium]